MHFCSNCSNMYYIRINSDDPNKLVYYCRKCGNEDKFLAIIPIATDNELAILLIILVSCVSYLILFSANEDIILFPASSSITALV